LLQRFVHHLFGVLRSLLGDHRAAEEFGRAVDHHVDTQCQRVLVQRRGEGVVRHHQRADAFSRGDQASMSS
jgi:hypothetical protein